MYIKWDWRISKQHYHKWQKHLVIETSTHKNEQSAVDAEQVKNIFTLIQLNEIAGRNHYKHMNCLRRCLCQQELLKKYHIDTQLHLGVKFVDGNLAAHSWLSSNNQVINDSQDNISTYSELQSLNGKNTLELLK